MLSVEIDLDEVLKGIEEHLYTLEQFRPAEIVIDNDHALYVEFGTGPASTKSPRISRNLGGGIYKDLTDLQYNLYKWIERANKGKGLSVQDKLNRMFRLYRKICENGIKETPFIRPAVQMAREHLKENLYAGMTLYEIAEGTADDMIKILKDKPVVSSEGDPESQSLLESISVRYMDPDDLDVDTESTSSIDWERKF